MGMSAKLIEQIERAEEQASADADAWQRHLILGIAVANGLGLTSEVGLLQAADNASMAAERLFPAACIFLGGLVTASAALLVASRAAAMLSRALFEQRHMSGLSGEPEKKLLSSVMKRTRLSSAFDRGVWILATLSAVLFAGGVVSTFWAVIQGALGT